MKCVICNKSFVVDLSVCPACGTMQIDSVREELITKVSTKTLPKTLIEFADDDLPEKIAKDSETEKISKSDEAETISEPIEPEITLKPVEPQITSITIEPEPIPKPSFPLLLISKNEKSEAMSNKKNPPITAKPQQPRTVQPPTVQPPAQAKADNLVEFQAKETVLPEWRLQLQNAVRERMQSRHAEQKKPSPADTSNRVLRTQGNAALKIAPVEEESAVEETKPVEIKHENETVRNALKRIEMSRQRFFVEEEPEVCAEETKNRTDDKKDFPFQIASRKNSGELRLAKKNSITVPTKPTLVSSLKTGKEEFDTNKLPPLPQPARIVSSLQTRPVEKVAVEEKVEVKIEQTEIISTEVVEEKAEEKTVIENKNFSEAELKRMVDAEAEEEFEKNQADEDFAPFTLRFNAGIFDLLIGSFASMILLSPFMLLGGDWFTFAGLFAFLATTAIVVFIYMTTAVGLFGKTFGMRLFALEIIDIENEDYPSFHQAAVSSAVYLASMALFGLGFLTVPFNEDQRAVHDLVSNTLVVKEL